MNIVKELQMLIHSVSKNWIIVHPCYHIWVTVGRLELQAHWPVYLQLLTVNSLRCVQSGHVKGQQR